MSISAKLAITALIVCIPCAAIFWASYEVRDEWASGLLSRLLTGVMMTAAVAIAANLVIAVMFGPVALLQLVWGW